jgi:putative addiction module CopG family antidote
LIETQKSSPSGRLGVARPPQPGGEFWRVVGIVLAALFILGLVKWIEESPHSWWMRIGKDRFRGRLKWMKVSLPSALEDFVSSQVKSGEFDDAGEVVREALRLLRNEQEARSMEEMRAAFAGVDSSGGKGEPTAKDRALIHNLIRSHRSGKRRE